MVDQPSYKATLDSTVAKLKDLGVKPDTAQEMFKKSVDVYFKGGFPNPAVVGDYRPTEVRAVLESVVRPYGTAVKNANKRRHELISAASGRDYTSAEQVEIDGIGRVLDDCFENLNQSQTRKMLWVIDEPSKGL